MLPCYHVTMLPCYHVTMLPCYHVTMLPCYHVTMLPCYHVTMLPCYHVTMLPCYHVTMLPCYHVTMLPCYHVTMLPCYHVTYNDKNSLQDKTAGFLSKSLRKEEKKERVFICVAFLKKVKKKIPVKSTHAQKGGDVGFQQLTTRFLSPSHCVTTAPFFPTLSPRSTRHFWLQRVLLCVFFFLSLRCVVPPKKEKKRERNKKEKLER